MVLNGQSNKLNNNQMKTNKKQTALSWLKDQIKDIQPYELACTIEQYIDEAKQMEREQMIKFANNYGFEICGYDYEKADEYYEETYGN